VAVINTTMDVKWPIIPLVMTFLYVHVVQSILIKWANESIGRRSYFLLSGLFKSLEELESRLKKYFEGVLLE